MGSHVIDNFALQNNFGTAEMRAVFDDVARLQRQLDVEAALALAEGELDVIPKAAAKQIADVCDISLYDLDEISKETAIAKHSLMGLINSVQKKAEDAGEYVHYGATTQDIVDTATVIQLKQALDIIERDLIAIIKKLAKLSKKYQHTVMVGRTHAMQALPITFGYKLAIWTAEFSRHATRLNESKERILTGNINGAVGTFASLGEVGKLVEKQALAYLELNTPITSLQSSRDNFSEYANLIGLISATLGKIGNEFYNLMRTEIGEIEEGFSKGKIGSSTMPHKRNPAAFETLASLTPPVLKGVSLVHESMHVEHERDAMSWRQEWIALPEISIYLSGQFTNLLSILETLVVREDRMLENLNRQYGLLLSEKVMFEVGKKLGKQTAHHIVYEKSMIAFEENRSFADTLLESEAIQQHFNRSIIEEWLDPAKYTGQAVTVVDDVYQEIEKNYGRL